MAFKKQKIYYIDDVNVMNKHLEICKKYRVETQEEMFKIQKGNRQYHSSYYFTWNQGLTKIELNYTPTDGKFSKFIFQLDGKTNLDQKTGMEAFALLQRMSNSFVNDMTNDPEIYDQNNQCWLVPSIAGIVWVNPKFKGKRISNCIGYDENSAWDWAMCQPMPNTNKPYKKWQKLKDGEIGFNRDIRGYSDREYLYMETKIGELCEFVFEKIESPFKDFVNYYYNKKKNAKTPEEKQKYKDILVFPIGYMARKNPFIRSAILSYSNYRIFDLIDPETTYSSNTDSLNSTVIRDDIELGEELGQFKIEHTGDYVYCDSGYQWNKALPSVRGKSKKWFENAYPNGFDILKDELPSTEANYYELDLETFQLKLKNNESVED